MFHAIYLWQLTFSHIIETSKSVSNRVERLRGWSVWRVNECIDGRIERRSCLVRSQLGTWWSALGLHIWSWAQPWRKTNLTF